MLFNIIIILLRGILLLFFLGLGGVLFYSNEEGLVGFCFWFINLLLNVNDCW